MISLDNGDKIRGDASVATVVDYILSGTDANAIKQLADGQLPAAIGDLYTADSVDAVTSIILVNTDSVARTVNLYLTPNGGSARRLIPKDMSLGIGHSLYTDGRNITVMDASGQVLATWAVDDTPVNGETDKPISSNWAYDHVAAADPHTGYLLESLYGVHSMVMAVSNDTPIKLDVAASRFVGRKASGNIAAMTGAEAMAVLSGQAAAGFSFNSQEITSAKLNALVLKGTFTADGTVVLPVFTAGGNISLGTLNIIGADSGTVFRSPAVDLWRFQSDGNGGAVALRSIVAAADGNFQQIIFNYLTSVTQRNINHIFSYITDVTDTAIDSRFEFWISSNRNAGGNANLRILKLGVLTPGGAPQALFAEAIHMASGKQIVGDGTGSNGIVLKNLKNSANTGVSGTVKTVEIDIGGTAYYFLVSPTSSA